MPNTPWIRRMRASSASTLTTCSSRSRTRPSRRWKLLKRLCARRIDSIKQGTEVVGSRVKVKVAKNKVAPPFRVAEFDIMFNEGISKEGGLLDLAVELGLVKKTGAFFSYGETRLGQGRENAREFLKRNDPIAQEIERLIRQQTLVDRRSLDAAPAAKGPAAFQEVDLASTFRGPHRHGPALSH